MSWKNNHVIYKSCKKKNRYPSYNVAMKYAKRIERKTGVKLYPYECQYCKGWHLSKRDWGE